MSSPIHSSPPPLWAAHLPALDEHFMRRAIDEANRCVPISTGYSVGAVLVRVPPSLSSPPPTCAPGSPSLTDLLAYHFTVASTGYSRELPGNTHAEECCIIKLHADSHSPAAPPPYPFPPLATPHWLYTTMEPCSLRLSGRPSCASHVLSSLIPRIVVGVAEPPVFVAHCQGTALLTDAGVSVTYLPHLAADCLHPNRHLLPLDK